MKPPRSEEAGAATPHGAPRPLHDAAQEPKEGVRAAGQGTHVPDSPGEDQPLPQKQG